MPLPATGTHSKVDKNCAVTDSRSEHPDNNRMKDENKGLGNGAMNGARWRNDGSRTGEAEQANNGERMHNAERLNNDQKMDEAEQLDNDEATDDAKRPGDDMATNKAEELPTNDISTPALFTTATDDRVRNIGSVHRKRKLFISPSNEGKSTHKFPRTANTAVTACTGLTPARHKAKFGTSQSALASRKIRGKVASKTYVISRKHIKNWKEKITIMDPDAQFDPTNPKRVFHSRCSTWVVVKEPGDTTRFRRHVEARQVRPIPAGGTLMVWFKVKEASAGGDTKERDEGKVKVKMPCCGVSDMDNLLVDQYLKQTGAGGGGGRSIHVISAERFKKKFRGLGRTEKEEVQETQRAEWIWRNDHLNIRVTQQTANGLHSVAHFLITLSEMQTIAPPQVIHQCD
jgi:hypothetical protein